MASKFPLRKVAGTSAVSLNYSEGLGRFLTAARELSAGTVLISEGAFAEIAIPEKRDHQFCQNCFKEIISNPSMCYGCRKASYCSVKCKTSAWKHHHWLECFMMSILAKVSIEAKLALRTLLEAACNNVDGTVLEKIAQDLSTAHRKSHKTDTNRYRGNYWGIYCLQKHENEPSTDSDFKSLYPEIQLIADTLMKSFEPFDAVKDPKVPVEERKTQNETRLKSLLKKLSFRSYHNIENFDIRSWKMHVEECCKSVLKSDVRCSKTVCMEEIFTMRAHSEKELLQRLLIHHALQVRTNGQAIFCICQSKDHSHVQDTSQVRIATGFFPVTSLMNHSCSPNTSISFDGNNISVVALQTIKKGEEICHCYGPHYSRHTLEERQELLKKQYFFGCKCSACVADLSDADRASFNLQFHAFVCKYCGDPLKPDKKTPSQATCINENCGKVQDTSKLLEAHFKLLDVFVDVFSLMDQGLVKEALEKLKAQLKMAESILYRNHINIARIHDMIAQCYVILEDYEQAMPHLSQSISITGMLHGTRSVEIAHELQKMASAYFNLGNLPLAGKIASRVMSIYKTHYHKEDSFPPGSEEMRKIIKHCG